MILFFSGGGRPWVAELCLDDGSVMLSYWININQKTKKMDSRTRRILKAKKRKGSQK